MAMRAILRGISMKKILGFVIIVIALGLGGYYGMGLLTERAIKKNIDVLNHTNDVNVQLKSYRRGLFCSHAVLDWTLNTQPLKNGTQAPVMIQMPLVIKHGPIIFSHHRVLFGLGQAEGTVVLPIDAANSAQKFTSESIKPTIRLSVYVSYFNQTTLSIQIPKFDLTTVNHQYGAQSNGLKIDIHISATHKKVHGLLMLDGMTWVNHQIKATLGAVRSDYALRLSRHGLTLGNANVSIPYLNITDKGHPVFSVKTVNVSSQNGVSKGLFHSMVQANAKQMILHNQRYQDGELVVEIKHLDADTLTKINNKLSTMSQQSETTQQNALFSILADLPVLVNKGGELKISRFQVLTPDGLVSANASLAFPNESITNPFLLVQKIQGQAQLTLAQNALKHLLVNAMIRRAQQNSASNQAQQEQVTTEASVAVTTSPETIDFRQQVEKKVQSLVETGVLVVRNETYVVALEFKDGVLKINNKTFSPSMLQV